MKYNGIIQKKVALLADYLTRLRKEFDGVTFKLSDFDRFMQELDHCE